MTKSQIRPRILYKPAEFAILAPNQLSTMDSTGFVADKKRRAASEYVPSEKDLKMWKEMGMCDPRNAVVTFKKAKKPSINRVSKAAAKLVAQVEATNPPDEKAKFAARLVETSKHGPGPLKHVLFVDDDHCFPNKFEKADIAVLKQLFSSIIVFRHTDKYSCGWICDDISKEEYRLAQLYTGDRYTLGARCMAHTIQMQMGEYGMRPTSQVRTFVASKNTEFRRHIVQPSSEAYGKWILCEDVANALYKVNEYNKTL